MIYLEILSGLHKGAKFSAENGGWVLGSSDENTVVVLDNNIPNVLVELSLNESGSAIVQFASENLFLEDGQSHSVRANPGAYVFDGTRFFYGNLSFLVRLPAKVAAENPLSADTLDASELPSEVKEASATEFEREIEAVGSVYPAKRKLPNGNKRLIRFAAVAGVISVLGLGYLFFSGGDSGLNANANAKVNPNQGSQMQTSSSYQSVGGVGESIGKVKSLDVAYKKGDSEKTKSFLYAAKDTLENSLQEARVLDKLSIKSDQKTIEIAGKLSRVERKKFERVLRNVVEDFGSEIIFKAEISSYDTTVTMAIKQIVGAGGQSPMIVLDDGERLFVGSIYKGNVVESISIDKVVLRGRDLIEVLI